MKMQMNMKVFLLGVLTSLTAVTSNADNKHLDYVYPQKVVPTGIDNYLFSTYYYHGKKTYNLRNAVMSSSATVFSLKINPSGSSFAVLERKGDGGDILIYDLWKSDRELHCIENKGLVPTAICYSPDSRMLVAAMNNRSILLYDTRDYKAQNKLQASVVAEILSISANKYYMAVAGGDSVEVWNLQNNTRRTLMTEDAHINDVVFSSDNAKMAVLLANGKLVTYNTKNFEMDKTYDALGEARHCYFHQDGKYIAVVTGDKRISVVNLMNVRDRDFVDHTDGGITDIRFIKDKKKQTYLAYNTNKAIIYAFMNKLSPFYTKLLSDELNDKMNAWMKRMPNESLNDYNTRVNDKTRAEQVKLYEREIATRMADKLVDRSEVTLGSYNPTSKLLAVQFSTMPNIYLNVPGSEVNDFADAGKIEFRNAVYGITNEDRFELIYADVYNKNNGKTYVFNNLNRKSLDYLQSDENFVPLNVVQRSSMEDMKLQEIKNNVIKLAKEKNTISDKTHISVSVNAVSDVDANGKKILNYVVKFTYTVDKEYSAKEDFGSGKYKVEGSGSALAMLSIMKKAFESDFAQYVVDGKAIKVKVTGMADGSPINGTIAYDGCYGDFDKEPVYEDDNLSNLSVAKTTGITDNDQLAFLRAVGVKDYIVKNLPSLSKMKADYNYYIDVAKEKGSEYRRITVEYTFVDAF